MYTAEHVIPWVFMYVLEQEGATVQRISTLARPCVQAGHIYMSMTY